MNLLELMLSNEPETVQRERETRYRWGDRFAVVVHDYHKIGQFASDGVLTRAEVEAAVRSFLEAKTTDQVYG